MAKSIRSKHRRKMRNIKREKFDKKQLVKLKATVARDLLANQDADMQDICTVKTASDLKADQEKTGTDAADKMEVEGTSSQTYDKKTLRNEHGQYPPWMNQRAIRKQQQKNKKLKKKGKKASAW